MGIFNMRLFILTVTLLFVQLSKQAVLSDDVSELAFPDGELGAPAARSEDDTAPLPEDEVMEPVARIEDDDITPLSEDEVMEPAVARSLDRKKKKSKKHRG